jgi:6-pyruvoyltetrahydropterin/6-carboxytetrahydropterin synthase
MYELGITTHFSAAHHLVAYPGACADLHGHNWQVDVFVSGTELDKLGMLADFGELKAAVGAIMSELDHSDLNNHSEFVNQNPTSERIARYIYRCLAAGAVGRSYKIARVTVHETPGSMASYWE